MSDFEISGGGREMHILGGRVDQRTARRQQQALPRTLCKRHQRLNQPASLKKSALLLVVVMMAAALVYVPSASAEERRNGPKLPDHVADLRDVILTAARSGHIEELRMAFDVSGTLPDLGISQRSDPIAVLKDRSGDPQGRDTLAAIVEMLEMPPSTLPFGNDIENNLIYVWPYLSTRPLDKLTAAEQVDLYRLVTPELAAKMRTEKRWLWWRLVIGADGTWILFRKGT